MPRLYRRQPDSSQLPTPRIFTRVFCEPGTLVDTVGFYRSLTGQPIDMDMDVPEAGLHIVAVGGFLIIELDRATRPDAIATAATVLVTDLDQAVADRVAAGAEVIQERRSAPVGAGARLRHPDGLIVEYVEHRPSQHDVPQPGEAFR
jgi:predicted enzyme related to lactoylglutathione lyase